MAEQDEQISENPDEFDKNILQHVTDIEDLRLFADIDDFKSGKYFHKTKFHTVFVGIIDRLRQNRESLTYLCGIQGLGKTSSLLYYILECRRNNDTSVHYIDLNKIEIRDKNLERFTAFSEKFIAEDCLIIDHITIFNSHFVDKIKEIFLDKKIVFIFIETGFTASAHSGEIDCGRDLQLDKEYFGKIWKGCLKSLGCQEEDLIQEGGKVYDLFSKRFLMTPRLLHYVLNYLYSYHSLGKSAEQALSKYTKKKQEEIANFKGCGNSELYAKFLLETAVLLEFVPIEGEYIYTEEQAKRVMVAINIFDAKFCKVTKEDIESNAEFAERNLEENDVCVKVRHLEPFLASEWQKRLPYSLEMVLKSKDSYDLFAIMFQNGGGRKEYEKLLVQLQKENDLAIIPLKTKVLETSYQPRESSLKVSQSNDSGFLKIPSEGFFQPDRVSIDLYADKVPEDLKSQKRNVAMVAMYIKELAASTERFLVYPQIENLMGFDYFVYFNAVEDETEACSSEKRLKGTSILYPVQVATGALHRGDTIGQALEIVKKVFSDVHVTVHAVVVVVRSDNEPYTLLKCSFEHLTVLNLYEMKESPLQKFLQSNELLYKCHVQLGKCKPR